MSPHRCLRCDRRAAVETEGMVFTFAVGETERLAEELGEDAEEVAAAARLALGFALPLPAVARALRARGLRPPSPGDFDLLLGRLAALATALPAQPATGRRVRPEERKPA